MKAAAVAAGSLVALVAVVLGIRWLAAATLTRHEPVPPGSALVVTVDAERRGGAEHGLAELVQGLAQVCHLEVGAVVVPGSVEQVAGERFRFRLEPALDDADERQLRGCLQDARVDHVLLEVEAMERLAPASMDR